MALGNWTDVEDWVDQKIRSGPVSEPVIFHETEHPQYPGAGISTALDGSDLRGVFGVTLVEVDVGAVVPIVSRTITLEMRLADLSERPISADPSGIGGQQWTIRDVVYRTIKVEDATPGWIVCQLQRSS